MYWLISFAFTLKKKKPHSFLITKKKAQGTPQSLLPWQSESIFLYACVLSYLRYVQHFVTLWAIALCSWDLGQKHWSGLPCPLSWDLHDPGVKRVSLISTALAGRFCTTGTTWEAAQVYSPCLIRNLVSQAFLPSSSLRIFVSHPWDPRTLPCPPSWELLEAEHCWPLTTSAPVQRVLAVHPA